MCNKFFKKSVGICAAALMIISAGGNTLTASARHYPHHKRTARRITRRNISEYRYKRGHRAYATLQRRLRYDKKRLKGLKRSFKLHKRGRLRRYLNRDRNRLLNDIRRCNRYSRRLKRFAKAPKSYRKPVVHRKHSIRRHRAKTIKVDYYSTDIPSSDSSAKPKKAHHKASSVNTSTNYSESQPESSSDSDSTSTNDYNHEIDSINTAKQAKSNALNYQSSSESASDTGNTISADEEADDREFSLENSESNSYKQMWQRIASSEANPTTLSNAAWSYINATSSEFHEENNPFTTKPNFAAALGHPYALDQVGPTPSAQQLNEWYNEHSINDDTRNTDAYYWYTRYNDGHHTIDDKNESNTDEIYDEYYLSKLIKLPDDISSFDGYEKLHHMYDTPIGGGGMSPQGASTQAAFDNNIDNNNIEGAADNLDQMGD